MLYITAIHLEGGQRHEHITHVHYTVGRHGTTYQCSRADMVAKLRGGAQARVSGPAGDVEVHVVEASPPYLRTAANGQWQDNLLALPRF
jgi:hypothetical protein